MKDTVAGSENFHQRRQQRRFGMWVCLIWWMGCDLFNFIIDLVDLGCGFVSISLVVFFFLGGVGGCGFVLVLAVGVVAAMVVGGCCCGNGGCTVVYVVVVVVNNGEELIYYFNVL